MLRPNLELKSELPMFTTPRAPPNLVPTPSDGETIEVVRRRRGRPPGSKNKPKPSLFVPSSSDNVSEPPMSPYILEISSGNDVVEAVSTFSRRKAIGICVLSASGTVSDVTLRHPSPAGQSSQAIAFLGRFEILSISATFLPSSKTTPFYSFPAVFSISLAGPQGQIVGGFLAGPLVAVGTVFVVAASFANPTYHRLPTENETSSPITPKVGGRDVQRTSLLGGGAMADVVREENETCGVEMYGLGGGVGRHDDIWTPTPSSARAPPHF